MEAGLEYACPTGEEVAALTPMLNNEPLNGAFST